MYYKQMTHYRTPQYKTLMKPETDFHQSHSMHEHKRRNEAKQIPDWLRKMNRASAFNLLLFFIQMRAKTHFL